ncbi:MAG: tetratricopeptide repeat protein [Deltaproteobacteria bacterium]|jgi:tetratricopeptide (TPR) repeat protein|nr:tetratricopeptide repeat protein [Deltaproteobacteria bacterium]
MSKKVPLKKLLRENDAFLTNTEKIYNFFLTYQKQVLLTALAVAVAIILAIVFVAVRNNNRLKASEAYHDAYVADDPARTLANMEEVRKEWKGHKADRLAAFSMVEAYVKLGRYGEAKTLLAELTAKPAKEEESLAALLHAYLGSISEEAGDPEEALKSYVAAKIAVENMTNPSGARGLTEASGPFYANLLNSIARVNASLGRTEDAKKAYAELKETFPDTGPAAVADFLSKELDSPLRETVSPDSPASDPAESLVTEEDIVEVSETPETPAPPAGESDDPTADAEDAKDAEDPDPAAGSDAD